MYDYMILCRCMVENNPINEVDRMLHFVEAGENIGAPRQDHRYLLLGKLVSTLSEVHHNIGQYLRPTQEQHQQQQQQL